MPELNYVITEWNNSLDFIYITKAQVDDWPILSQSDWTLAGHDKLQSMETCHIGNYQQVVLLEIYVNEMLKEFQSVLSFTPEWLYSRETKKALSLSKCQPLNSVLLLTDLAADR